MRRTCFGLLAVCLVWLALAPSPLQAQNCFPMITHASPVAVQAGTTAEVVVAGQQNFAGVYRVLIEGTGVTAEPIPDPKQPTTTTQVKLKVTVAADAQLGVREFRVVSHLGVSSTGQLLIVADPVVQEPTKPNNTREQASEVPVPSVVCGRIEAVVDVDWFRFTVQAGQTLTFETHCARIQDKIHDLQKHANPLVTLYDHDGRELAFDDSGRFADALFSYTFKQAGTYYLQIRDSRYDGDPRWVYALSVSDRPYVAHAYPLAAAVGAEAEFTPIGSARLLAQRFRLLLPNTPGLHELVPTVAGKLTNPVGLIATTLPLSEEREPNDTPASANSLPIPGGVNGRIGQRRDLDHFKFQATKGKAIRFEIFARRFGYPLYSTMDAVLDILDSNSEVIASKDDSIGKDPVLVFTPPADGQYIARIRDLHSKGGEAAIYFLQAEWASPSFTLRFDPSKGMIGPGSRTAGYVHVVRENGFTGPVQVRVDGLPKGVTASDLTIPPTMTQGVVVFSAAEDAVKDASNISVIGQGTYQDTQGQAQTITQVATANEEIYLPGGGRGRFDVRMHSFAITDPSDILDVAVQPREISLNPGQEVKLDVQIKRRPGFDKGITLDVMLRHLNTVYGNPLPPGVTVVEGKSKTLLGSGSSGHITLKAAANAAPIEQVPISVLAHASVNFVVKMSYSSPAIALSIRK